MKSLINRCLFQILSKHDQSLIRKIEEQHAGKLGLVQMGSFQPNDVFVCGWPKSGNTWFQRLLTGIVWNLDTHALTDTLAQELVPDVHMERYYRRYENRSYFKSHERPLPEYRNVIHLVRDGRDALVSYWHMRRRMGADITMREFLAEKLYGISWSEHSLAWIENPYQANLIRVRYEDLLSDTVKELERVCAFLNIDRDKESLTRIARGASFEKMKKLEKTTGWRNRNWPENQEFLRKGKSGSYLQELNGDDLARFERDSFECLNLLGYQIQS